MPVKNGLCQWGAVGEHLIGDLFFFRSKSKGTCEFDHRFLGPDFSTRGHETSVYWVELNNSFQGSLDQVIINTSFEWIVGKKAFIREKKTLSGVSHAIGGNGFVAIQCRLKHRLFRIVG